MLWSLFAIHLLQSQHCPSIENGTDFHGHDCCGGTLTLNSTEACCTACQSKATSGCRFWTFAAHLNHCYLKNRLAVWIVRWEWARYREFGGLLRLSTGYIFQFLYFCSICDADSHPQSPWSSSMHATRSPTAHTHTHTHTRTRTRTQWRRAQEHCRSVTAP